MYVICHAFVHSPASTAVSDERSRLAEYGRYVQEMLPKYVQLTQITHR